ncbi:hypothetical protein RB195_012356 [Necator americanus]|uniref:Transposase n=1 Tax=Necator americanus TaxID=51031 RepID=A0ABR1D6Q4_NECAM
MEMLMAPLEQQYKPVKETRIKAPARASIGKRATIVVGRVCRFFEELKRQLGKPCRGTIFNSSHRLSVLACGVSIGTVKRALKTTDIPSLSSRKRIGRISIPDLTLKRYELEWGEVIDHILKNQLTQEKMTVEALHSVLRSAYPNFPMSKATLYRFLKAIGISCWRENDHLCIEL